MIIRLPKKFIYTNGLQNYAYVNRGKLYVKGNIVYENLMYNLSYALKGYDKCCYCGNRLTIRKRTIDHIYPRRWGGVSISNNLLPCCKNCNLDKQDMTYQQFQQWRNLTTIKEQERFYNKCIEENIELIKKKNFILPESWVVEYDVSALVEYFPFKNFQEEKYQKTARYYKEYKKFPHPLIVSSNDWVFKGYNMLLYAKRHKMKTLPAIILENVIVIKNSP